MGSAFIYGVYWKDGTCLRHFYEMDDAIEWCKKQIDIEVGRLYDNIRYCCYVVNDYLLYIKMFNKEW